MVEDMGQKMRELADFICDAKILALNCTSPLCTHGCCNFELCYKCNFKKTCLDYMAKKFIDEYTKKGFLV